jgi:hypothetical protein
MLRKERKSPSYLGERRAGETRRVVLSLLVVLQGFPLPQILELVLSPISYCYVGLMIMVDLMLGGEVVFQHAGRRSLVA